MTTPRGIRNNNPGNLERNAIQWQGMSADQSGDPRFIVFDTPVAGTRALAKVLLNYDKKGFDTVREIITRWAPGHENNTDAYIKAVAAELEVDPDEEIFVDRLEFMLPLVKAIIRHENGQQPYSDKILTEALRQAGVSDAPQASLTKKVTGDAIAAGAVGLGVVSQVAEPAKRAADSLSDFIGSPIISNIVTGLLTVAGVATLARVAKTYLDHKKGL